jgi:TolB-like protein
LADAIIHKAPDPPSTHNRKVSPGLESIIIKALDKDPDHRYQSAREMRVDLERLSTPVFGTVPVRRRSSAVRWLAAAACVVGVTAILIALNVGGMWDRFVGKPVPSIESIAVLPLENLSGDPEQEYFADGMTEALITELSKIGTLKVISRTSAMLYKDSEKPLPEIAEELNVEAVVEGSVFRTGDRVRVTAQLVHAATDKYLWAENYDRDLRDILALYSEVARGIAAEVQVKLTAQEERIFARVRSVDPEAHEAYLWGNYFFNRASDEAWRRAIDYYEQAIEKDPRYAPAYSSLALTLALLPYYPRISAPSPPEKFYPRAREAAQAAIELDDTLATAHIALGLTGLAYEWQWMAAEREFQRAIELEPGSAEAHIWYGLYLVFMGRGEGGIAKGRRAVEVDPLSLPANTWMGAILYMARRYEEAIKQLKKVLDMEPNFEQAHNWLYLTYVEQERYQDALAVLPKWRDLADHSRPINHSPRYARLNALWGKREEALSILSSPEWSNWPPWTRAVVYGALGEKDEAFRLLDQAHDERSPFLAGAKVDPRLDPLRDDPRFQDLLRRMNFPE